MDERTRLRKSAAELLRQEYYTPEELHTLLGIGLDVIRRAAYAGSLKADIVGHDIMRVHRRDVLDWLNREDYGLEPLADVEAVP
jgi:excisionase family DNA binding protein